MYAQLGDIFFQALKGFTSYEDTRETIYAQHQRIEGKPKLQRTGEALNEISLVMKFHAAFCDPEVEYDALNDHRVAGDILSLILGNGFYEGDFVITQLKKTLSQTDDDGSYIEINVEVSLLEYSDDNKIITRQQRAKLDAFAVDVERPLPASVPKVDRTLSAQLYQHQQAIRNDIYRINQKFTSVQNQINEYLGLPNAIVNMAQQFVNIANKAFAEITPMSARVASNIALMDGLLSGNAALFAINPTLQGTLAGGTTATNALNSALNPFNTLPSTISNSTQGQYCLDVFTNAKNANDDLLTSNDAMFSDFALFATFIALRRQRL